MLSDLFWDLAAKVGIPFALLAVALLSGRAGVWVWGREVTQEHERYKQLALERDRQLSDMRNEWDKQLADMRSERNYYRDKLFATLGVGEAAVARAEQAIDLAERRRRP